MVTLVTGDIEMNIETKYIGGNVQEVKEHNRNGIPIGIVIGHIATFDVDRGDFFGVKDKFAKKAFDVSLADLKKRKRQMRFKDHHGRTIGGFPIDKVIVDKKGLFGEGEINLDVQQGREAFSLAKQGVLSDFSIGFSIDDFEMKDGIRIIKQATIWEGSIVDEPMNPKATITIVKSVVPFKDFPLADRDRAWSADTAIGRVREFTDSTDEPSASYKNAFVWYDREDSENFGAYKLPIADVINGKLTVIPRAIFAAAAAMQGARGGVDIPEAERAGVIRHLERYYAKMDLDSPFSDDDKQYFITNDVEGFTKRQLEDALHKTGSFSKGASRFLASKTDCIVGNNSVVIDPEPDKNGEIWGKVLNGLEAMTKTLRESRT